MRGKKEKKM
ncbi:hypothetical protein E2C01_039397 [Portunus trituberculatus]|uniref:Uncharacterized protein n=1 Tax=Portunus trituberculatus TaxID=210409 RepID=A0A5B7FEM7_PORTR|nr:hypothetical protein [Portunus trituberculatus]